jgi:polyisoprenoid-binding protein YceI
MRSSLFIAGTALLLAMASAWGDGGRLSGVQPGSYKVDPNHTQVVFSVSHFGFTNYSGLFSGATGTLQLDPAKLSASKLNLSIPVDSVTTTSSKMTEELKGDKWFDTAKFPNATFVSTRIVPTPEGASVTGNLTLHGVTKPVVLRVRFVGSGVNPLDKAYTVGFEATGTVKRSEFGVTRDLPVIGDGVHLKIAGAFERQT